MPIIKRVIAGSLMCALLIVSAACGGEQREEKTTASSVAATTSAAKAGEASQTVLTSVSSSTTKSTKKNAAAKTEAQEQSITNAPGASEIDKLIARTTNVSGNATKKFINSLKGYELNILYAYDHYGSETEIGRSMAYARSQVEKEYGVTINEKGMFENYNEQLATSLAARNCESQIYMVQNFNFCSWFKNKYLCDLTSAMTTAGVDLKEPWYVQDANAFLNIDFRTYGWISYDADYVFPFCILYNSDLIRRAKLNDPAQLAEKGQWTWDTLEKYAKKLNTSKTVGFGSGHLINMFSALCTQNGTTLVKVKRGYAPESNITDQKVKNALNTLVDWCGPDGFTETFEGKSWTFPKTQFANGKIAMLFAFHDDIQQIRFSKADTKKFALAPFPTKNGTTSYTNVAIPQFVNFIPTQYIKQSAKILFLRNELYRQNYRFAQRDFDVKWRDFFSSESVLEDACNIKYAKNGNKTVFSWEGVCETGKVTTSTIMTYAVKNGGSIQTAIDKYRNGLKAGYDDIWKGHKITGRV